MCLNCGCGNAADDRGKAANITIADLREAAAANGQTVRESARHILDTVEAYEHEGPVSSMAGGTGASSAASGSAADRSGAAGSAAVGGGAASEGNAGLGRPAGDEPAPASPRGTPGSES